MARTGKDIVRTRSSTREAVWLEKLSLKSKFDEGTFSINFKKI